MYLKGKMVLIRAIELSDCEMLRKMINDSAVEEMMWGYSFPVSQHKQMEWIEKLTNDNRCFRGIIDVSEKAIGEVILSDIDLKNGTAEIHIKLAYVEDYGKGYGTDTIHTMLKYCFEELRLQCVYCRVKDDNEASKKMFIKCGFVKEGELRSRVYRKGKYYSFIEYSILKEEFDRLRCEK